MRCQDCADASPTTKKGGGPKTPALTCPPNDACLEVELRAQLDVARLQNTSRPPQRLIRRAIGRDGVRVGRVVEVHAEVGSRSSVPENLREPQVELVLPIRQEIAVL